MFKLFVVLALAILLHPNPLRSQWVRAEHSPQGVIAFAVQHGVLFSAYPSTTNTLYRSTDSGKTWIDSHLGLSGAGAVALYGDDSLLLAGTDSYGVFRSSDMGASWHQADSTWKYASVNSFAAHNGYFFAGGQQYAGFGVLLRSSDAGMHWEEKELTDMNGQVGSIVVQDSFIFAAPALSDMGVSTDDGNTWNDLPSGLLNVATLYVKDSFLFAASYKGPSLYRSSNRGSSWIQLHGGFDSVELVTGIVRDGNNLYASAWDGAQYGRGDVYRSENNGDTWLKITGNLDRADLETLVVFGGYLCVGLNNAGVVYRRPLSTLNAVGEGKRSPEFSGLQLSIDLIGRSLVVTFYKASTQSFVTLQVFDLLGRKILSSSIGQATEGLNTARCSLPDLTSGAYTCRIIGQNFSSVQKFMIVQ